MHPIQYWGVATENVVPVGIAIPGWAFVVEIVVVHHAELASGSHRL
jgi:hypothetical protein